MAASYPALEHLTLLIALLAAAIGAWVASKSVAIPLAIGAIPPLVDAIVGSDPLPKGGFTLLFSALIAISVGFVVLRRQQAIAARALLCVPVLASFALLGLMVMRLGGSLDEAYGSTKLQLYVADVLMFLVAAVFVGANRRDTRLFINASFVVAAAGALMFLIEFASGSHAALSGRYSLSAAEYPIELGRESADGLLLAIYLMLAASSRKWRTAATIAAPLLAISLIAAGSRGPMVAFAVGAGTLVALTAVDRRARVRLAVVACVFLLAAIVVPLVVPGSAIGRALSVIVGSASGLSSNGRSTLWTAAITEFSQHMALGIGWGGFAGVQAAINDSVSYPHNVILEVSCELGIVGGILILTVLAGSIRSLARLWQTTSGDDKTLAALLASLFITALINACFSGAIEDNREIWMWAGLAFGIATRLKAERGQDHLDLAQDRSPRSRAGWSSPR
ncbi:MAG: O-antigen ligase family protein [Solirubrobacteraceae bacterium]